MTSPHMPVEPGMCDRQDIQVTINFVYTNAQGIDL